MKLSSADFLRSRPQGAQLWLDTFGSSMSPFLHSGDALLVERGGTLSAGDIAVLARADGAVIAHLVTSPSPLRTSSLLGTEDLPGLEPLGRAVRVRARGVELPVNAMLRKSLLASHSVLKVGRARAVVQRVLATPAATAVRREVLKPEVRTLRRDEEQLALLALGDLGALFGADVLRAAFTRGAVVGALARGKPVALAALVPGTDRRFAQLSLTGLRIRARGLELEPRLIALCIVEAQARGVVRLEVAAAAADSLASLVGAGFAAGEEGGALALTLAAGKERW